MNYLKIKFIGLSLNYLNESKLKDFYALVKNKIILLLFNYMNKK